MPHYTDNVLYKTRQHILILISKILRWVLPYLVIIIFSGIYLFPEWSLVSQCVWFLGVSLVIARHHSFHKLTCSFAQFSEAAKPMNGWVGAKARNSIGARETKAGEEISMSVRFFSPIVNCLVFPLFRTTGIKTAFLAIANLAAEMGKRGRGWEQMPYHRRIR